MKKLYVIYVNKRHSQDMVGIFTSEEEMRDGYDEFSRYAQNPKLGKGVDSGERHYYKIIEANSILIDD
jgi:hypothetical protein